MNIKQSIALIFLLLGVSFSAYSSTYRITSVDREGACNSVGDIINPSNYSCSFKWTSYNGDVFTIDRCFLSSSGRSLDCQISWDKHPSNPYPPVLVYTLSPATCPPPLQINPVTGVCEEICAQDEVLNPDTLECELVPYCSRPSTQEAIFQAELECSESKGIFKYECHNGDVIGFPQGLKTTCTQPNECVIGMPHWPECLGDLDPDGGNDLSPPSGDFVGGDLGTSNPAPPTSGSNPPPEIPPSSGSDAATVAALGTLQTSLNNAIVGTNTDMNQGFSDVNNSLDRLNSTNTNIGRKITEQMNQDYQIHLKEKQLMLQQTAAIQHSAASINAGLDEQTLLLGEKLDAIKPCDPNTDIRSCEGQNGMNSDLVANVTEQVDSAVTSRFQSAEKEIIDSAQGIIDDSKLGPVQGHIDEAINIAMSAFPSVGNCTSFSIPTPLWGDVQFGCEFSVRFKSVASFIIYIYTIWSLIDILLNGVTPAASTVPHRSRGI